MSNVEKGEMIDSLTLDKVRSLLLYTRSSEYPHRKKSFGWDDGEGEGSNLKVEKAEFTIEKSMIGSMSNENVFVPEQL
jgi:hypothetical protein